MNLKERCKEDIDCFPLVPTDQWLAVVNMIMNFWVPRMVGNFLNECTICFSRTLINGVSYETKLQSPDKVNFQQKILKLFSTTNTFLRITIISYPRASC
jgi:hypothetical protein